MTDYHLILKRMLWFTVPILVDDNKKSELFIDFMYHQLIPELLEGTMIIIKNNHLADELMVLIKKNILNKASLECFCFLATNLFNGCFTISRFE